MGGRGSGGRQVKGMGVYGRLRQGQENGHARRVSEGCNDVSTGSLGENRDGNFPRRNCMMKGNEEKL